MALINVQRFRDVLVRTKVAEEAPALEVSVALEQEISDFSDRLATSQDINIQTAYFRQALAELHQLMAEQEARHQRQLNRLAAMMLPGAALIAAIASVLVVVLG